MEYEKQYYCAHTDSPGDGIQLIEPPENPLATGASCEEVETLPQGRRTRFRELDDALPSRRDGWLYLLASAAHKRELWRNE